MSSQPRREQEPPYIMGENGTSSGASIRPSPVPGGQYRRSEDSWIEVASQPSSSSLSSATTNDEIVTTGLRIRQQRRRRGLYPHISPRNQDIIYSNRPSSATGSSQDENEETESESDHIMSSSNEDFSTRTRPGITFISGPSSPSDVAPSSDEDDTSTALGFNPQPNAFSHPPVSQRTTSTVEQTRFQSTSNPQRTSRSNQHSARHLRHQQQQHSPYNMIAPSHHADHDAALRASLSTLLSCAAAARGLPKNDSPPAAVERTIGNRAEPPPFRLVPESVAMGDEKGASDTTNPPSRARAPSSPVAGTQKARRKTSFSKDHSTSQPSSKKTRRTVVTDPRTVVSPTVMTWVISAGVVVLFSAISFSAGYVLGREVGRTEAGQGIYGNGMGEPGLKSGAGCGKEVVKSGLRTFRWVGGGTGSGISA